MGCPDAVRAELLKITGVLEVIYHPEPDLFSVSFESVLVSLETIFAAVFVAGKKMGQEYLPEIIVSSLPEDE
jgi:copper chaperone CopZ